MSKKEQIGEGIKISNNLKKAGISPSMVDIHHVVNEGWYIKLKDNSPELVSKIESLGYSVKITAS